MPIVSRPYRGDADLHRMRDLIVAASADGAQPNYWHVGDLLWGMYQNTIFDPFQHVRLWEREDGALLGFAWLRPPSMLESEVDPRYDESVMLAEQMLAWGELHRRALPEDADGQRLFHTSARADDPDRIALLQLHGFTRDDHHLLHMHRDLDRPIPDLAPPVGFVVRHVGDEAEWAERVEIHREVWQPSKVTLEAYRRLRAAPGYLPALDLVAVAPSGGFASYCICWLDPANQTGEFVPVGTRAAFRGKGIGKALMLAGLRRLKAAGARAAIVYSVGDNAASIGLYESVGFTTLTRNESYSKRL
jgi:ribosomal protein S18 acetylase RimI-like enzyme